MNKVQLKEIAHNNYSVPENVDTYEAVQKILCVLDSTDPELRDELGMTILSRWIINQGLLSSRQLEELLKKAISDEMLFYRIGEKETDNVFLRSFSSLLIALILYRDNADKFLSRTVFCQIVDQLFDYCSLEKDLRGFVLDKGWAHAAAHMSDAIDECARSRYAGLEICHTLWNSLLSLIKNASHVYDAEEEERLATPVVAMVELGKISMDDLITCLDAIEPITKEERIKRINFKMFIRTLYMRLKEKNLLEAQELALIDIEHRFNPYFYQL